MSLTLETINYTYGKDTSFSVSALVDVSLEVSPGELVLVLGSTGSGKSTLLRVAAGLLVPDGGTATVDGRVLDRETARGAIGLVFQDPESQLFAETVMADVVFGPRNFGASREEAERTARESLGAVGLDPATFAERSPFSLSGGEARRVAVAGVLASGPRYLLADEPTAGLDAPGRHAMLKLLLRAKERAGVVIVSHSAEEFLAEADRVLVLRDGGEVINAQSAELVSNPELFRHAGLRPPDVLEVQRLAAAAGMPVDYTLDPREAAERLASAAGGVR